MVEHLKGAQLLLAPASLANIGGVFATDSGKHSSLFGFFILTNKKVLITLTVPVNLIKLFVSVAK
jgi:hypothetical protein